MRDNVLDPNLIELPGALEKKLGSALCKNLILAAAIAVAIPIHAGELSIEPASNMKPESAKSSMRRPK